MKKKSINYALLFCLMAAMPLFVACADKDYYVPSENEEKEKSSLFDFSTTESVKINLNYQVPEGYATAFNLYAVNPYISGDDGQLLFQDDLKPLASGISISGRYGLNKDIPAYVKELYAYSASPLVPTLMHAAIVDGIATFESMDITRNDARNTRAPGDFWNREAKLFLGQYGDRVDVDNNHRPNYIAYTEAVSPSILANIAAAFPEQERADPKYYADASMYLYKNAKIYLGVIGNGAWWDNTLSYFCFKGTKEELATKNREDITEVVAFPSVTLRGNGGLKIGDYVQLKYYDEETKEFKEEFPEGTTIGWMLRSQSYDAGTRSIKEFPYGIFYSVIDWNVEGSGDKNHTMRFNAGTEKDPFVCFGFEDDYNDNKTGDRDCNDVIFHMVTDPKDAIEGLPIIDDNSKVVTYDKSYGIIAFEDNWPAKGDYDLNDVVVKYESSTQLESKVGDDEAYVTEIVDVFSMIHTGADYNNSFSYKMDINPSIIETLYVNGESHSYVPDGSGVIIDLCQNIRDVIPPYAVVTTPMTYKVEVKIKEKGMSEADHVAVPAPYNPFISPKKGVEVHLPFYQPTSRVDTELFNTGDDCSNPGEGQYYVSGSDCLYPYAIHLSNIDSFVIPTETKSIDHTYPQYAKWVESNFEKCKDWYFYPN